MRVYLIVSIVKAFTIIKFSKFNIGIHWFFSLDLIHGNFDELLLFQFVCKSTWNFHVEKNIAHAIYFFFLVR